MNKKQKVVLVVTGTYLCFAIPRIIRLNKQIRAEQSQIDKMRVDLSAILVAAERMQQKIESGTYRPRSLNEMQADFQFEIIAAHYN